MAPRSSLHGDFRTSRSPTMAGAQGMTRPLRAQPSTFQPTAHQSDATSSFRSWPKRSEGLSQQPSVSLPCGTTGYSPDGFDSEGTPRTGHTVDHDVRSSAFVRFPNAPQLQGRHVTGPDVEVVSSNGL